jgi:hypothetical protein
MINTKDTRQYHLDLQDGRALFKSEQNTNVPTEDDRKIQHL